MKPECNLAQETALLTPIAGTLSREHNASFLPAKFIKNFINIIIYMDTLY